MRFPAHWTRSLGLGLLGALLIAALVYGAVHSGPLAPTRVTVMRVSEGSFAPALFGIGRSRRAAPT